MQSHADPARRSRSTPSPVRGPVPGPRTQMEASAAPGVTSGSSQRGTACASAHAVVFVSLLVHNAFCPSPRGPRPFVVALVDTAPGGQTALPAPARHDGCTSGSTGRTRRARPTARPSRARRGSGRRHERAHGRGARLRAQCRRPKRRSGGRSCRRRLHQEQPEPAARGRAEAENESSVRGAIGEDRRAPVSAVARRPQPPRA